MVSDVGLAEFGEEGLREHLEDLQWLEEVARTHDRVVGELADLGPVAPLRLATICRGDVGVRARLEEWYDALTAALDRVAGRAEWSVKAYTVGSAEVQEEPTEASPDDAGPGAAYLRRKRTLSERRLATRTDAAALARLIHDALAERSVASRRLPPQDPRLTGHEGTMTLNGAYLVPFDSAPAFEDVAGELSHLYPEARLEVQGPWPPYSFATLDEP